MFSSNLMCSTKLTHLPTGCVARPGITRFGSQCAQLPPSQFPVAILRSRPPSREWIANGASEQLGEIEYSGSGPCSSQMTLSLIVDGMSGPEAEVVVVSGRLVAVVQWRPCSGRCRCSTRGRPFREARRVAALTHRRGDDRELRRRVRTLQIAELRVVPRLPIGADAHVADMAQRDDVDEPYPDRAEKNNDDYPAGRPGSRTEASIARTRHGYIQRYMQRIRGPARTTPDGRLVPLKTAPARCRVRRRSSSPSHGDAPVLSSATNPCNGDLLRSPWTRLGTSSFSITSRSGHAR